MKDATGWRSHLTASGCGEEAAAAAIAFYGDAFGLTVTRRFGADGAELSGWPVRLYLLQKPSRSLGAAADPPLRPALDPGASRRGGR
jgi:hypothetical protein